MKTTKRAVLEDMLTVAHRNRRHSVRVVCGIGRLVRLTNTMLGDVYVTGNELTKALSRQTAENQIELVCDNVARGWHCSVEAAKIIETMAPPRFDLPLLEPEVKDRDSGLRRLHAVCDVILEQCKDMVARAYARPRNIEEAIHYGGEGVIAQIDYITGNTASWRGPVARIAKDELKILRKYFAKCDV